MTLPACETPGWQLKGGSRFKSMLESSEVSVHISRLSSRSLKYIEPWGLENYHKVAPHVNFSSQLGDGPIRTNRCVVQNTFLPCTDFLVTGSWGYSQTFNVMCIWLRWKLFVSKVEAHGEARTYVSGCNRTKGTVEREGGNAPEAGLRNEMERNLEKYGMWGIMGVGEDTSWTRWTQK